MGDEDPEPELARLIRARAYDRAAACAYQAYGAELYGFLVSEMGSETDASEVFSQAAEDLCRGLPDFAFRCSVRTWVYVLARHAAARFRRSPWNRGGRTRDAQLDAAILKARTPTQPWLRTDVKQRFRALRESLVPEERTLLVLRIDRGLPWSDIARIMSDGATPDEAAIEREAVRLRKRYQLLKSELRRRARESGLLDESA